jgi:prepilin-type N-terminal cleavage/methylation domain-containing protein
MANLYVPRIRKRRGFTLAEVLVSLTVLCLAVLAVVPALLLGNRSVQRAQHTEVATQIAQERLEKVREAGYTALAVMRTSGTSLSETFAPGSSLPRGTGLVATTRLAEDLVTPTTNSERCRVSVTVSWTGVGNNKGAVTLTTLVTPD